MRKEINALKKWYKDQDKLKKELFPTPKVLSKEVESRFLKGFRTILIENDDLNQHMNNVNKPIKGDIYFDGIETEQFIKSFLAEELERQKEERDKQILSWHELPIKKTDKLGLIRCDLCGGDLFRVRGRYPDEEKRLVCPTCAIEILESIYSNLYPNNQASSISPNS